MPDPSAPDTAEVRPGEAMWVSGQGWIINAGRQETALIIWFLMGSLGRSQELMSLSPSYKSRPMVAALASRTESIIEVKPIQCCRAFEVLTLSCGPWRRIRCRRSGG